MLQILEFSFKVWVKCCCNEDIEFVFINSLHFELCKRKKLCMPLLKKCEYGQHVFNVTTQLCYCSDFMHSTVNPPPLWSQPSANNYMEEDKWQHPQKSKTSEVPGSSGNPQHSARGLWNLWMQSWESQRRHSLQRPSAGLQWVGACAQLFLLHFSLCVCVHFSHSQVENSSTVLWVLFLERTLLLSVWFCMGWEFSTRLIGFSVLSSRLKMSPGSTIIRGD